MGGSILTVSLVPFLPQLADVYEEGEQKRESRRGSAGEVEDGTYDSFTSNSRFVDYHNQWS